MTSKKPSKSKPLPELFIMENGSKFSSGWLSQAIFGNFKKPLDPTPLESQVHEYVLRRVNQGQVFNAMLKALEVAAEYTSLEGKDYRQIHAALKLARKVL